jgi:hypothetical protein
MALIGYWLLGPDNGSHMYQGDADPPRCESCGVVSDSRWVDPAFRLTARGEQYDLSYTYDGCLIVSERFRIAAKGLVGMEYLPLPGQRGWFLAVVEPEVAFDVIRRRTKLEGWCASCGRYTVVAGAAPVYLVDAPDQLPEGFHRTDVAFGTGDELHPLVLVGAEGGRVLAGARLRGLSLEPVRTDS